MSSTKRREDPEVVTVMPGASGSPSKKTLSNSFNFGPWIITTNKSHILPSCCQKDKCMSIDNKGRMCSFCQYEKELDGLPKLPEMVFADNVLRIVHERAEFGLEFNALDALRLVDTSQDCLKVACADAWRESRIESEHIKDVIKPFDWTYTTSYSGSLLGKDKTLKANPTERRIDVEKLKVKEKILFYDDIHLFEDELADNGCAHLSVKIRAMPSGFFVLQRFYLRVDGVLVRVHDTRLHYEAETDYVLREYSSRESSMADLEKLPASVITDPDEIYGHLKLKEEICHKLEFSR